jgi:hypothetical protein
MSLARVHMPINHGLATPRRVQAFLDDASARIDAFVETHRNNPATGFVPSDYAMVYRTLDAVRREVAGSMLPGNAFCEWGSGLGVITCLAAMTGYDAVGIEIEPRLVETSLTLAREYHLPVRIVQGSYVPDGHELVDDFNDSHVMTLEHGRDAYEELGLDPDDFDCIFAYPWPGEDDLVSSIFDRYAARGAMLITFHGQDGVMLRRKVK